MSKLRLKNGTSYTIGDYATSNSFVILLDSMEADDVLETLTEENLSEIQFVTDSGTVTGVYYNQLLHGYSFYGNALAVIIDDAELCRYGLVLDSENRIVSAEVQRFSPADAVIVDKLPDGMYTDYLYVDGEYIYSPLPMQEQPDEQPDQMKRIAALEEQLTAYEAAYTEGVNEA